MTAKNDPTRLRLISLLRPYSFHPADVADALIEAGVFVPPKGATFRDADVVKVTRENPCPWQHLEFTEDRVRDGHGTDITESYNAWLDAQPRIVTRTYEWEAQP